MNTQEVEKLARSIAEVLVANINKDDPVEGLWSYKEIAEYLSCEIRQVRERYAPMPGFPQAIRLPSTSSKRGHPRWKREDIIKWTNKFQERRAA